MLVRLLLGLVTGLVMMMPRGPRSSSVPPREGPTTGPPGSGDDWTPLPTMLPAPNRELPSTPPPGYHGTWPPADPSLPTDPPIANLPSGPTPSRPRGPLSIMDQIRLFRGLIHQGFSITEAVRVVRTVDAVIGSQQLTPKGPGLRVEAQTASDSSSYEAILRMAGTLPIDGRPQV